MLSSDIGILASLYGCDGPSITNAADDAFGRFHRIQKVPITAMAISAIPPTTPPTIAPVFELPLRDGDDVGEREDVDLGGDGDGVVTAGKSVGNGEEPVGPSVAELETPINSPGPISGLPEKCNREGARDD